MLREGPDRTGGFCNYEKYLLSLGALDPNNQRKSYYIYGYDNPKDQRKILYPVGMMMLILITKEKYLSLLGLPKGTIRQTKRKHIYYIHGYNNARD